MNTTLLGDETDHHFRRRPSSAWAKNAAAFRMISLASFNSRFSRSSSLMRALSARRSCSPGISSCSARKIHFRSVSGEQPIFSATLVIADHLVSWSPRVSRKSRTALSRTAGEYLTCELIRTSSQRTCPPANPVRFTREAERERLKQLERENKELRQANEILRKSEVDSTCQCNMSLEVLYGADGSPWNALRAEAGVVESLASWGINQPNFGSTSEATRFGVHNLAELRWDCSSAA